MTEKPLALVIEDDEDLSFIFTEAMRAAGYKPEAVKDGQLALDRLSNVKPDVVILDLHLPHVSGAEILTTIRASDQLKEVRVVVVSADARMAEQVDRQADFTLIKPISFSLLRDITSRLCQTVNN